ncbi:uncharacterized protein (TIGR03083 family) [Prauserella shujinwangii]|uniref:Uncharacterized protein (TIGR03083 family) n=1 Tax=Prauserella shujinwangii TaxID=1453103 RepID=A0A2T0LQB6_9PSEU|nr:uncharacterized protein (TIGR03083 family) [Prauserella shujinwangii]
MRHIARVHSWTVAAGADPSGENVRAGTPPDDWDALLAWWEEQREALRKMFTAGPDAPAWLSFGNYTRTVGSWARRQAHEAAIHRIDAELARGGGTVQFDPAFAGDGIDELLAMLVWGRRDWSAFAADGTVLVHAEDIGRLWTLRLLPGKAPRLADTEQPFEPDVTVEGSADAVYRAVWRRPSAASVTGDAALLEPLAAP